MLILNDFVVLNFPKTGSTFVRHVLKEIHYKRKKKSLLQPYKFISQRFRDSLFIKELLLPSTYNISLTGQHGGVHQIPEAFRDKDIVSVARNPLTRLISIYNYRWWANNNLLESSLRRKYFPQFPNLNIIDFIEYRDMRDRQKPLSISNEKIGFQSVRFLKMYASFPNDIIANINTDEKVRQNFYNSLKNIEFLKQENLVNDLIKFLVKKKYTNKELKIIQNKPKINISYPSPIKMKELHIAIDYILEKEKILLECYKAIGINYKIIPDIIM